MQLDYHYAVWDRIPRKFW